MSLNIPHHGHQARIDMALAYLKTQIGLAKVYSTDALSRNFMPAGSLSRILSPEKVKEALCESKFSIPPHKLDDTTRIVIEDYPSIFAILLELSCESYLTVFIEHYIRDHDIPLTLSSLTDVIPHSAAVFETLQLDYNVHSFRKSLYRQTLPDKLTLPFVSQERIGGGGYSSVYEVTIHPSHHNFIKPNSSQVCAHA